MINRILLFLLTFVFAYTSTGIWDCGCALALDHEKAKVVAQAETTRCHHTQDQNTSKKGAESDDCCRQCKVENSAIIKTNVFLKAQYGFTQSIDLKSLKTETFTVYQTFRSHSSYLRAGPIGFENLHLTSLAPRGPPVL